MFSACLNDNKEDDPEHKGEGGSIPQKDRMKILSEESSGIKILSKKSSGKLVVMPLKRCGTPRWATTRGVVAASGSRAKCDLCLANIVKDEALQCEGACQRWFHRYCAGVSQIHFKTLTTSDSPFVCCL